MSTAIPRLVPSAAVALLVVAVAVVVGTGSDIRRKTGGASRGRPDHLPLRHVR